MPGYSADIIIVGGGLGGCAAALAATRLGCTVVMIEEYEWIGGQLTSQAVPPDEHPWIETHGRTSSYAQLRELVRTYYREAYPLKPEFAANPNFNPGQGWVSNFCCEPKSALFAIETLLEPAIESEMLVILTGCIAVKAEVSNDKISSVLAKDLKTGDMFELTGKYFIDASEFSDLIYRSKTDSFSGSESQDMFGEMHAPSIANPNNVQALTWCFAMSWDSTPGANHTIGKPINYDSWRDYMPELSPKPWPGKLFSLTYSNPVTLDPKTLWVTPDPALQVFPDLFTYRRVLSADTMLPDSGITDVTIVNWPQNDYLLKGITPFNLELWKDILDEAQGLSRCLFYWMQTEMPRIDGNGTGYPGLMLRPDITGTSDGFAMAPYIRESTRIKAVFTVTEEHVGAQMRKDAGFDKAESFYDSIGVGYYRIDLHPSTGGDNYIDVESLPFEIPLGALLPVRMKNLLPACKNIGTTHITNGCYRLHPVEWNIGESAGYLAAWCVKQGYTPHQVRENKILLAEFQALIQAQGVEIGWPE